MFEIKRFFKEEDLTINSNGDYKIVCPDCGLQGGRTDGFILFSKSNTAYCHTSHKHFSLIETYALTRKLIRCIDGNDSGDKKRVLDKELFKETLGLLKEEYDEETYDEILSSVGIKKRIELPGNGILISDFANTLAAKIKNENIFFYRGDTRRTVEVGKIKQIDGEYIYNGFVDIDSNRFITLIEKYFIPWSTIYTKNGSMEINKSMNSSTANIVLVSDNFRDAMPLINRIFNVPIPIIHDNKIAFPKRGYDRRFSSWLPYNAPQIDNDNMSLEDAKKVIDFVFGEFCFKSEQDKTNAIAGFITPFLRGLFKSFSTRTPVFVYEANRERAGKDYCAGLTGILYEGFPLEEPPISTGDKFQTSDELKKKLLSAMIYGRKRLHFSNNKGYINNAIFESVTTAEKYSDRILGRSEVLTFNNEIDFSLSGNTGMTLTPDLANRCRFVRLFLDIENANARTFKTPDLWGWLKENRNLVLSALYSLVKNWIVLNSPPGKVPFASFQEWSKVCGGVLEAAGYGSPCVNDIDTSGIAFDTETTEMKTLFEICFEKYPNKWIDRHTIIELVKATEDFGYIDWNNKSDQIKFGLKVVKFVGRIFSDIKLVVKDKGVRTARWEYKFEKNGNVGNVGNDDYANKPSIIEEKTIGTTLPTLPSLPKQIKQSILKTTSDREVQFYDAEECKDICFKYTKKQVLDWIKENPDGYTNFKELDKKFGVGSFKIRNQLKDEGLI